MDGGEAIDTWEAGWFDMAGGVGHLGLGLARVCGEVGRILGGVAGFSAEVGRVFGKAAWVLGELGRFSPELDRKRCSVILHWPIPHLHPAMSPPTHGRHPALTQPWGRHD